MNLLQRVSLYGLTIAGLNGLFYNKSDSQVINDSKSKLEVLVNNRNTNGLYSGSEMLMYSNKLNNSFSLSNKSLESKLQNQDVVYLKNGSIIRGKIVELTPNKTVKIKTADGSIFVYKMDEVEKISMEEATKEESQIIKDNKKTIKEEGEDKKYNAQFSFGYGNSFGGFGAALQGDISEYVAVHAGGGYFPLSKVHSNAKDMFMAAGGIKTYFSNKSNATRFFLDLQFGMLGGEYKELTTYLGKTTVSNKEQKALYGPSALLGGEVFFGNGVFGLMFAGGASYNLAKITWKDIKVLGAIDLGFALRF